MSGTKKALVVGATGGIGGETMAAHPGRAGAPAGWRPQAKGGDQYRNDRVSIA